MYCVLYIVRMNWEYMTVTHINYLNEQKKCNTKNVEINLKISMLKTIFKKNRTIVAEQ